ncbi:putative Ig domain-containing protein [Noviherbaspirillum sp. ST9]|uniref:putative Ig domain-containing protein n=1 Tax=Noviherbaspirillum sp. ST9 TaxID=3401606 RepID=UPI003B588BC0
MLQNKMLQRAGSVATGRVLRVASLVLASTVASGCGGGGAVGGDAETLYVNVVYPLSTVGLLQPGTITPTTSGFEGHSPACSLAGGTLPPGMQLNSDCSVTGAPTAPGTYSYSVRVGAEGAKGSIDSAGTITVNAPTLVYAFTEAKNLGSPVDKRMSIFNWPITGSGTGRWTFSIVEGALPAGLTLDPATGNISGVINAAGTFAAKVSGTLSAPAGSYTPREPATVFMTIGAPAAEYPTNYEVGYTTTHVGHFVNLVPLVRGTTGSSSTPTLNDYRLGSVSLPAGLSLDNATGTISGRPAALAAPLTVPITARVAGSDYAVGINLTISVDTPFAAIRYEEPVSRAVGAYSALVPRIYPKVGVSLDFTSYQYAYAPSSQPDCMPGMTLHGGTGMITGSPTTPGTFTCNVILTATNLGVSWQEPISVTMKFE